MRLEERMFSKSDTQTVLEHAARPEWHLDKAHAMYELAIRSLEDPSLLDAAWNCIGKEIVYVPRQGPPLGQPAAALLLDSGQKAVEKSLVATMQDWSVDQQRDFFYGVVQESKRHAFLNRLIAEFGFAPKIEVSRDGSIA
ncbi:hypothetical protein [Blastopirellula marina]|uniref:Uncharacterized protein n=1 Tax=Blastopirellula marina TaxID=124 RepID=A0A2S8F311_9BACT|nr:hypothetical protein [Blastopirellula marina]PQO26552.1 hypothetical protein C5Y98_29635 [Blastopirellula marina]PTL40863.1 hypothetical protein C5Y97_29650 [Blastopirellula marina]